MERKSNNRKRVAKTDKRMRDNLALEVVPQNHQSENYNILREPGADP